MFGFFFFAFESNSHLLHFLPQTPLRHVPAVPCYDWKRGLTKSQIFRVEDAVLSIGMGPMQYI